MSCQGLFVCKVYLSSDFFGVFRVSGGRFFSAQLGSEGSYHGPIQYVYTYKRIYYVSIYLFVYVYIYIYVIHIYIHAQFIVFRRCVLKGQGNP